MKLKPYLQPRLVAGLIAVSLGILSLIPSARGNVYATNVKLNNDTNDYAFAQGGSVQISYILNEQASRGVTLSIRTGATVVATMELPPDTLGTFQGFNSVVWNGRDAASNAVPPGVYTLSINAKSSGYTNWNQLTSETEDDTWVYFGQGIEVDRNPTSLYYGRIFVANAKTGLDPLHVPGDVVGIRKFNADASPADEGLAVLDNGHDWAGGGNSPLKIAVSDDDFVYISDLAAGGEVFRWDPTLSSNSFTYVLRQDNRPGTALLSGPAVSGGGTNTQLWMADTATNGVGIRKWAAPGSAGCVTNDLGVTVVGIGANSNFTDVALDQFGNIYTCQPVYTSGDPRPRVFRFPAYNPSTNGGQPELIADWAAGGGNDEYAGANGLAVDPTGTYVAVAFRGIDTGVLAAGNTKILFATNGALAADIDLGVTIGADSIHDDMDCAWDAVGNVYYIDNWAGRWRAVSPPGTNQATTVAVPLIEITPPPPNPPEIESFSVSGGNVVIDFTSLNDTSAAAFSVWSAPSAAGPYSKVTNAVVTFIAPGSFEAIAPTNGPTQFYRIRKQL